MDTTVRLLQQLIREELTKADKADIKSLVRKEIDKELKKAVKKAVETEVEAMFKAKATKER